MPLPKIEDARKYSDQELSEQIAAVKRELFDLRFQKATRQLEKTHQFKHARHRLAQLMTVERERQVAQTDINQPEGGSVNNAPSTASTLEEE